MTPRPDSPHFPLDTLLLPHDMVTTIEPMQEGICPLVPTMERGVVVRVEVTKRQRVKVPRERSGWIRGWLVRRYMLTRTIAHDPLARTIQPSWTHPLEDQPNRGLVSTQPMCIQPASDSHIVWHAHRLLSPVVGHRTPCMTPEPLGPFVPRPAPIQACHPEPIDGWLTSLWSQLCHPCPCMCIGGSSTTAPLSPLHPLSPLPSHLPTSRYARDLLSKCHVTCRSTCPIPMSDPDTSLPLVRAIIRIGVPSAILDQVRLREMLGYIVIPGAVWILSLISEDNHCTR